MSNFSTIYKLSVIAFIFCCCAWSGSGCPVLECWFVQEKPGQGGLSAAVSQEKSLMFISPEGHGEEEAEEELKLMTHVNPDRVYYVTDPAGTLCSPAMNPPEGSVVKPKCEIHPFTPHASSVRWAAALTAAAQSPTYLQAEWLTVAAQGLHEQLTLSSILRAPPTSCQSSMTQHQVVLSISSKRAVVRAGLGEAVLLDCGFWVDPASPLHGAGFSVEWRYQFRGEGRLVIAYDGVQDRLVQPSEEAELDLTALTERGDASLLLKESSARHTGTYICTVYVPHVLAQVVVELQVVEPPELRLHPSPLPLLGPAHTLQVQCHASGFLPHTLELHWSFTGGDGATRSLGQGLVTGHRGAADGTFSQSSRLQLEGGALGRGGVVTCEAVHEGETRRVSAELSVIGVSAPSVEDSMVMVAVALVLYGAIKLFYWTFSSSDADAEINEKKEQ